MVKVGVKTGSTSYYLGWLVAVRVALCALCLLAASSLAFFYGLDRVSIKLTFQPLLLIFFFCGLSALYLKLSESLNAFTWVQLVSDAVFITILIEKTGGAISPFLVLYLPHVMAASLLVSRRGAFVISAIDFAVYALLVWSLLDQSLAAPNLDSFPELPSSGVALQLLSLASAMFLIAVASSFLARKLNFSDQLVHQSQLDLVELGNRQRVLLDNLPEGLITTGLDQAIISINQAALDLLCIKEEQTLGRSLEQVLQTLGAAKDGLADFGAKREGEISINLLDGRNLLVHFQCKELTDEKGEAKGNLVSFRDVTKLKYLENKLALHERMARLLASADDHEPARTALTQFVGESAVMQKIFGLIQRVAPSDATVLIDGESGTGKELVARAIHLGGPRQKGPFIPVNCGAIPENLIESELFGHRKGAFTGADSDHTGLFRRAEGGTIFLDEIGELPLHMQSKLLRALQEKSVRPVGADRDLPISVRIIAATNRNLKRQVELGRFREDLYYRLNVIHLMLPPLRDRKEDLLLLVNSILRRLSKGAPAPMVTPAAMELLQAYTYPGNVRELENILERAFVFGGDVILPEHFPENVRSHNPGLVGIQKNTFETTIIVDENISFPVKLDEILDTIERKYLEIALVQTSGAKKRAANLLGINFRSLRYRLQKYGIGGEEEREAE